MQKKEKVRAIRVGDLKCQRLTGKQRREGASLAQKE